MTDLRRYLSARKTTSPTLGPDGTLAVLTDTTGTMQVWTVSEPGGWPDQRTFYDERLSFVSWAPDGSRIAFGKDAGANEHDQLFVLDPTDGRIEQLTDRPDAIHAWSGWSPEGERVAFAANRRERDTFDVYVLDAGDGTAEPRPLTERETTGWISAEGWSPSGDRLVLRTSQASAVDSLSVVEVATGEWTTITPEAEARYRQPTFGPDGEAVYCLSDATADTTELVRIDPENAAVETVESGGEWPTEQLALAGTGRLALTRNVGGYAELHVGRLAAPDAVATTRVDVPEGVVHDLSFGPGGERLATVVSGPQHNHSAHVVDPTDVDAGGSPATERWTTPSTGGLPLVEFAVPSVARYESFDGREIPAYVTFPDGVDAEDDAASVPVVVDIHGGPHHQRRPWFRPIRQVFLDRGYAVFEPNVRGSSGYGRSYAALDDGRKRMDSVQDVAEAVGWLRERPAVDPAGVVAYGRSYGGFMVLSALTEYPELWAAGVEFVGIANWVTFLENTGDWRRSHREAEYGSLAEDRSFLESISPIHAVDRIDCPLFVQHGENDPRVPVDEARQIAGRLRERDVPVETCIFEDEGHHTTKLENRIEQFERIVAFLDQHVG